jgi:toxin-antitoxin system PIN domain toxin
VKLVDVNVLIYAVDETSARHAQASEWVTSAMRGSETIALAWVVLLAFVRLTTHASIMSSPLTPEAALDVVDGWLSRPNVVVAHPTDRHAQVLREMLGEVGSAGNLTTDAHLAAIAIEHGAELCSCDADFSRFPGLRWRDPLRAT